MFIDLSTQSEIIQNLCQKLQAYYIFPEVAGKICQCLQTHLEARDYSDINEGEFFALALTYHLQEVNQDEHLWVKWHPESLPDDDDALRLNPAWQEEQKLKARLDNFGIHRLERLPGNIGIIDIRYLHKPVLGGDTVMAAMAFLTHTNALLIDLRNCSGGYPGMIALVASFLFGPEPIHLSNIYWRDDNKTQQYWTLPYVPGERYVEKPVYVLISKVTFSAGEELASILQTRQRATIIGEKTDGGAHPGTSYRLHPHFEVFIPIGQVTNPVTGEDLEGIGVSPDFVMPQEKAYSAAYHLALKEVLASLAQAPSETCQALAREAEIALNDLASIHHFCPGCSYPNPLHRTICKNCVQPLIHP